MGQYEYVNDPNHPRRNKTNQVYVHVIEAENKLGRPLDNTEVVHHIDGNKLNNSHDNLIVFKTKSDHTAFHRNGCNLKLIVQMENGAYKYVGKSNKTCPICSGVKDKKAIMCTNCRKVEKQRNSRMPKAEVLKNQLIASSGNFCLIAREYGVTDNAVRKWCKKMNLPFHSSEYWHDPALDKYTKSCS